MSTLTKEESEQMAELLSKLGIQEPAGIETLTKSSTKSKKRKEKTSKRKDYLLELTTKVLPRVKKRKERHQKRKDYLLELTTLTLMKKMRKGREKATVLPKLAWFCGQTLIPKGHVSFEAWKHEVKGLMKLYDTQVVIQSIRCSLRSPAAEVVWHLGIEAGLWWYHGMPSRPSMMISQSPKLCWASCSWLHRVKRNLWQNLGDDSIQYNTKSSSHKGEKGGKDENDDEFVQKNFFQGLKNDAIREALRPQLDKHKSFNALSERRSMLGIWLWKTSHQESKSQCSHHSGK